jgi:hypothetical protein
MSTDFRLTCDLPTFSSLLSCNDDYHLTVYNVHNPTLGQDKPVADAPVHNLTFSYDGPTQTIHIAADPIAGPPAPSACHLVTGILHTDDGIELARVDFNPPLWIPHGGRWNLYLGLNNQSRIGHPRRGTSWSPGTVGGRPPGPIIRL